MVKSCRPSQNCLQQCGAGIGYFLFCTATANNCRQQGVRIRGAGKDGLHEIAGKIWGDIFRFSLQGGGGKQAENGKIFGLFRAMRYGAVFKMLQDVPGCISNRACMPETDRNASCIGSEP